MSYYNIHSHQEPSEATTTIYNLSPSEILSDSIPVNPNIFYSAGIHPWHIPDYQVDIHLIKSLISTQAIVAIGEVGLDKMIDTPLSVQIEVFRQQIELAEDSKLPLIIHCVKAWDQLLQLYREYKPSQAWIIHGFRGGKQQAEQLKIFGFYFSIGEHYDTGCLSVIYPTHMFIETDESNIPIEDIYANIAKDLNCSISDLQSNVEQNVSSIFDLSRF